MQVANNNLFKRLKKRKMKDSILNSITWIVSSFGFIVLITLFIFIFAKEIASAKIKAPEYKIKKSIKFCYSILF